MIIYSYIISYVHNYNWYPPGQCSCWHRHWLRVEGYRDSSFLQLYVNCSVLDDCRVNIADHIFDYRQKDNETSRVITYTSNWHSASLMKYIMIVYQSLLPAVKYVTDLKIITVQISWSIAAASLTQPLLTLGPPALIPPTTPSTTGRLGATGYQVTAAWAHVTGGHVTAAGGRH